MIVSTTTYLYVDGDANQYYIQGGELIDRGVWDMGAIYQRLHAVDYDGGIYVAVVPNSGQVPTGFVDENWSSLVIIREDATVNAAGSDYYARLAAGQAQLTAQVGTNVAYTALLTAWAGTAAIAATTGSYIHDAFGSVHAHHVDFGYGTDQVWAGSIPYANGAFTTVAQALDSLLYVPVYLNSFANSANQVEIGSTVAAVTLTWAFNKAVSLLTLTNAGTLPSAQTSYLDTGPWTTNQTWTVYGTDRQTVANGNTSLTFLYSRYWGVSVLATLTDSDVLALSSELFSTRVQTRTLTLHGNYAYFAYPDAWGAATFTVNGLANTAWTLVQRAFVNASGRSATYRIYRSDNLLTGTYQISIT